MKYSEFLNNQNDLLLENRNNGVKLISKSEFNKRKLSGVSIGKTPRHHIGAKDLEKISNDPVLSKIIKTDPKIIIQLITNILNKELYVKYEIKSKFFLYYSEKPIAFAKRNDSILGFALNYLCFFDIKRIKNIVTHEVAHVIANEKYFLNYPSDTKAAHGKIWQRIHKSMGGTGTMFLNISNSELTMINMFSKRLDTVLGNKKADKSSKIVL